jgi:lipopolysaccharide heptosyltransferase I
MDRLLIIRLSSLGDIIHTLPAFSALRSHFPEARIRWAVEEKGKEILDLVSGIDEAAVFEKDGLLRSAGKIRGRDQTALDFQGLVKSALLAFLSRSRRRVGFARQNLKEPLASCFYTERSSPVPEEEVHVISKNLKLAEVLGVKETRYEFSLRIPEGIVRSVESKLFSIGRPDGSKIVVYNVGAAWKSKRWFPEKWTELMTKVSLSGAFPVLLWGNEDERGAAESVSARTGVKAIPFLTIKEVLGLLRSASLVVSGDTFALQAACALDVPVVALFGPTNPRRNGPFRERDRVVFHQRSCSPCYKHDCSPLECMESISVEEVAAAVNELWESHGQREP